MERPRTSPIEEWESVAELDFSAQLEKLVSAHTFEDFMKIAVEMGHKCSLGELSTKNDVNQWLAFPAKTDPETGNMTTEIVRLGFVSGRIEISHSYAVRPPGSETALEYRHLTAKLGVWYRQDKPKWEDRYKLPSEGTGTVTDIEPTEDHELYVKGRVIDALVLRKLKEDEAERGTVTVEVRGGYL